MFSIWKQRFCTVCAKKEVPVSEVGGVVGTLLTVMSLVVGGSTHAGKQFVQSPGQVVATVVLHGQPAVEEVEEGFTEGVAAQQPRTAQSQQQQRQQLSRAGVLCCQGEGNAVLVVQVVHAAVQPWNPDGEHKHTQDFFKNLLNTLQLLNERLDLENIYALQILVRYDNIHS